MYPLSLFQELFLKLEVYCKNVTKIIVFTSNANVQVFSPVDKLIIALTIWHDWIFHLYIKSN